ncbi:hypothetical protein Tco_0891348 [Tanacetum coccineum]|uniref:Uncharacterized protein n=1 Tax=Tanacetum coccineum TaxID=301880 RepID=A0ABQ5C2M0_9ASTR
MQGTSLSRQERECKLYDEFDKFYHVKEWGKFVTDVKLARDLHTSNYDQLYAYLEQHEAHANEAHLMRLAVLTFLPGDGPIACINKAMEFLSAMFTPRYPSTNNQLRSSSNPRNQATVQDGRVTVKQRLLSARIVKAEGKEMDEEQLAFLVYLGVADGQVAQTITHNASFQADDLDVYDSDYDDICTAKVVLMINLLSCDSDFLFEVPYSDTFQNDMMNQGVQELQYSEQTPFVDYQDNEITSDSNIIPYS